MHTSHVPAGSPENPIPQKGSSGIFSHIASTRRTMAAIFALMSTSFVPPTSPQSGARASAPRPTVTETSHPEAKPLMPRLREVVAIRGEAVETFMLRAFGTKDGWQLLVDTQTGLRVRRANRDLLANHSYVLARDEAHARVLSLQYRQLSAERRAEKMAEKQAHTKKSVAQKAEVKKLTPEKKAKTAPKSQKKESQKVTKKADVVRAENVVPLMKSKKSKEPLADVMARVEALGFDLVKYLQSCGRHESRGNHKATNETKGKKLGVNSERHAIGKYQFTHQTLRHYGIATPEQRQAFLGNPKLQERLMVSLTTDNIREMLASPACVELIAAGVKPQEIVAAMHHAGSHGIKKLANKAIAAPDMRSAFFQGLRGKRDWLKTRTDTYVHAVTRAYDTVAEAVAPKKTRAARTPDVQKEDFAAPIAISTAHPTGGMEMQRDLPGAKSTDHMPAVKDVNEEIETVPVASNIIPFAPAAQVDAILSHVESDTTLAPELRDGLVAKLQEVGDLVSLYRENIEQREMEAHIGSQEAKDMLPGLRELLRIAEAEQSDLRASAEESIMHYEMEARKGSAYAKSILPKLYALVEGDDQPLSMDIAA